MEFPPMPFQIWHSLCPLSECSGVRKSQKGGRTEKVLGKLGRMGSGSPTPQW